MSFLDELLDEFQDEIELAKKQLIKEVKKKVKEFLTPVPEKLEPEKELKSPLDGYTIVDAEVE